MAVVAGTSFAMMKETRELWPVAFESATHQIGPYRTDSAVAGDEDLLWLRRALPVAARLYHEERFYRAFSVYDQAQWSPTLEMGTVLVWTAIEALMLGTPASAIEAAVAVRNMSARYEERKKGEAEFGAAPSGMDREAVTIDALEAALVAGKIICYAQGFGLILEAAKQYGWAMPLPEIAKIWRNGCIIRSSMLNDMSSALSDDAERNLMLAPFFSAKLKETEAMLRQVVAQSALHGLPVPALSAALSYFDIMRTGRSTANMLQGQRDFFGAHGFERTDKDGGGYHGPWAMG